MTRFDKKYSDLQQMCTFLWIYKQSRGQFDAKRADFLLRKLQLEFFGSEAADFRENSDEFAQRTFEIFVMLVLYFADYVGWTFENPIEIIRNSMNKQTKD